MSWGDVSGGVVSRWDMSKVDKSGVGNVQGKLSGIISLGLGLSAEKITVGDDPLTP